ncbi:MAG: hypothetical protein WBP33_03515 [Saprospiraceae bacterium]
MEIKIIISLLLTLSGCKIKNEPSFTSKENTYGKVDIKHSYFELKYLDSVNYLIEWGTPEYKNTSRDTFEILGNGSLEETESNNEYIVLAQSCGTSCVINTILPLYKGAKELTFMPVLFNDINNSIIVLSKDTESDFELLNYKSNKSKVFNLPDICPAAEKSMCIDSIYIEKDEIYFKYQGNKWQNDKPDNKVKSIRLE